MMVMITPKGITIMAIESSLDLQSFYPDDLRIERIEETQSEIVTPQ